MSSVLESGYRLQFGAHLEPNQPEDWIRVTAKPSRVDITKENERLQSRSSPSPSQPRMLEKHVRSVRSAPKIELGATGTGRYWEWSDPTESDKEPRFLACTGNLPNLTRERMKQERRVLNKFRTLEMEREKALKVKELEKRMSDAEERRLERLQETRDHERQATTNHLHHLEAVRRAEEEAARRGRQEAAQEQAYIEAQRERARSLKEETTQARKEKLSKDLDRAQQAREAHDRKTDQTRQKQREAVTAKMDAILAWQEQKREEHRLTLEQRAVQQLAANEKRKKAEEKRLVAKAAMRNDGAYIARVENVHLHRQLRAQELQERHLEKEATVAQRRQEHEGRLSMSRERSRAIRRASSIRATVSRERKAELSANEKLLQEKERLLRSSVVLEQLNTARSQQVAEYDARHERAELELAQRRDIRSRVDRLQRSLEQKFALSLKQMTQQLERANSPTELNRIHDQMEKLKHDHLKALSSIPEQVAKQRGPRTAPVDPN